MYLRTLRCEQVRDRIADRDPPSSTRVQRTGRVRRHELQVDAAAREHVAVPEPIPGVHDVSSYRVAFKSNDRIIAHLDRRDHGVTAEVP